MSEVKSRLFYNNFAHICKVQGTSPHAVTLEANLGKSTAANWKANGTIPKMDVLEKLAEILNCRVSDFFKSEEEVRRELELNAQIHEDAQIIDQLTKALSLSGAEVDQLLSEPALVDENVREFISIYNSCTARQRNQLMTFVFDFEQKVLNA